VIGEEAGPEEEGGAAYNEGTVHAIEQAVEASRGLAAGRVDVLSIYGRPPGNNPALPPQG